MLCRPAGPCPRDLAPAGLSRAQRVQRPGRGQLAGNLASQAPGGPRRCGRRNDGGPDLVIGHVEHLLRDVLGCAVHDHLGHQRDQLLCKVAVACVGAVLQDALHYEVPELVAAERLRILDDRDNKALQLSFEAMFNQALHHAAAEAVPGDGRRPLRLELPDHRPDLGRGQALDEPREHVVPVRRLVEHHGVIQQLVGQLAAAEVAADLQRLLDQQAAVRHQCQG
mmetsp:Transcript_68903/g.222723  ORF Transcript_68903/g.222723 Transcript_68903/m.222723 type:complete len:224 (-) Transcript_68903:143-814(-)